MERTFDEPGLDATVNPLQRFARLLETARATPGIIDATAMTLATVSAEGRPSARIVLLKDVDAGGLAFYTNYHSRKGREILARPDVALVFHWAQLEVQVRFEGRAVKVSAEEADAYFASRARGSQLGAWASHQSAELSSREELEARLDEVTGRYQGREVPRPPHWSGFRVAPTLVEFWKGRPSRLHEREVFTRAAPGEPWSARLLNP